MSTDDAEIGLVSPTPRWTIPYSVSMPTTFWMATKARYRCIEGGREPSPLVQLQVLTGRYALDGAAAGGLLVLALGHEHPQEDDALALLAGDLGPVVGVGGVGQVLVLLVLLPDRGQQVVGANAPALVGDLPLDGQLLGPAHDVLDHGPGREVLEVHDLFVAVLVRDLDEAVLVGGRVHLLDGPLDHRLHRLAAVATTQRRDLALVQRQVSREVPGEDLGRGALVRPLHLDLHVEPAGPQDGGVDEILAVGRADHDDVLQGLNTVDLGQQLRHDRRLHVRRDAGPAGAEQRVHLVKEHDDGHAFFGLLPGPLEDQPDLALRLADVLVQ